MDSPVGEILQSYTALASSLLDRWNDLASRAASRIDSGVLDSASAAQDAADAATLAAEGGWLWADWVLDSVAKCVGGDTGPNIVESKYFDAKVAGAKLELAGPLVKGAGPETLPAGVVTIELGDDPTKFKLHADATVYRGGTYVGMVNATTDAGDCSVITVWIVVP